MKEKPSGFVIGAEHSFELLSAHALLGGSHQLSGQNPFAQGNVATLHDGVHGHRERLAAVLAFVDAGTGALALQFGDALISYAAAGAHWTIRPKQTFQMLAGRVIVVKNRSRDVEFACHDRIAFNFLKRQYIMESGT